MKSLCLQNDMIGIIHPYFIKKIHFIGIGGVGMCGLARIVFAKGYNVTGSDIVWNSEIECLSKIGIKIFLGHNFNNINNVDIVVISNAIHINNLEVQAAKFYNIPIMKRSEMLSELMRYKYNIVIAGTHGKTTTTAMLTSIYLQSGLDPTFLIGGLIKSEKTYARLGHSCYFITESDESDRSFLYLCPTVGIITNIDYDHMCTYNYNFKYLETAFIKFLDKLPVYGYAVVCIDNPIIRKILPDIKKRVITYGFSRDAYVYILNYCQYVERSEFTILIKNGKRLNITLNIPGRHNALNAVASIAVSIIEGMHDSDITKAMFDFQGINRRFENLGYFCLSKINGQSGKIMIIDDYGHHPSELRATITTIRAGWPNKRLIMIFQPHRFTRTYELYNDFICTLSTVDILLMLNIYPAGEKPILNINSKSLCDSIMRYGKIKPLFVLNKSFLLIELLKILRDGDLILIQGAGTVGLS